MIPLCLHLVCWPFRSTACCLTWLFPDVGHGTRIQIYTYTWEVPPGNTCWRVRCEAGKGRRVVKLPATGEVWGSEFSIPSARDKVAAVCTHRPQLVLGWRLLGRPLFISGTLGLPWSLASRVTPWAKRCRHGMWKPGIHGNGKAKGSRCCSYGDPWQEAPLLWEAILATTS